ncbi:hypothetical protein ABZ942_37455 [Nocardia sp. NPDC046473]|uniref:hypothetical protein n=1 Tax=Nocardia sp. NPDC046473 TaxID=3155733 RepID=UPI0033D76FAD
MVTPGGSHEPEDSPDNRGLVIAAVLASGLVLVVAVGLLLRSGEDSKDDKALSSTPSASLSTNRDPAPVQLPNRVSPGPATPVAPVPQPVRKIGDNCSAGGIAAQWDLRRGQWACVPQAQVGDVHRIGDDCSHDGIVAQWGRGPDGRSVCLPQGQGRDEHAVGDDCSHDGIVAQWSLTSDGQWVCIAQDQGAGPLPAPLPVYPEPPTNPGPPANQGPPPANPGPPPVNPAPPPANPGAPPANQVPPPAAPAPLPGVPGPN